MSSFYQLALERALKKREGSETPDKRKEELTAIIKSRILSGIKKGWNIFTICAFSIHDPDFKGYCEIINSLDSFREISSFCTNFFPEQAEAYFSGELLLIIQIANTMGFDVVLDSTEFRRRSFISLKIRFQEEDCQSFLNQSDLPSPELYQAVIKAVENELEIQKTRNSNWSLPWAIDRRFVVGVDNGENLIERFHPRRRSLYLHGQSLAVANYLYSHGYDFSLDWENGPGSTIFFKVKLKKSKEALCTE